MNTRPRIRWHVSEETALALEHLRRTASFKSWDALFGFLLEKATSSPAPPSPPKPSPPPPCSLQPELLRRLEENTETMQALEVEVEQLHQHVAGLSAFISLAIGRPPPPPQPVDESQPVSKLRQRLMARSAWRRSF